MAYVYRNHNTGDEVTFPSRSVRLDHLDNWELVSEPDPEPTPESDPPAKPKQSDPKAVWVEYIAATTDLSTAEAEDLSKAELVELANE